MGNRYSAGIGGGYAGAGGTVTVSGGTVTATGGKYGAGIGGGYDGGYNVAGSNVTISGGTVTATGGENGAGIGGGYKGTGGTVAISGGSIKASSIQSQPKNAANDSVYCVTVPCTTSPCEITGLNGYGTKDILPIDGKVYLYLPNGTHVFTIDGVMYRADVKDAPTTAVVYTGPTCEGGEIEWDDAANAWVITPNAGVTEITVAGLPDGDTVAVPPTVTQVNGVADAQIKVKSGAYDITGAFTITGGAIALNPNGSATIGGETIPVKPTIGDLDAGEAFVVGDTVSVTVKAIPGLKYGLVRGDTVETIAAVSSKPPYQVVATGTRVTLTDDEPPAAAGAAFYRVVVGK